MDGEFHLVLRRIEAAIARIESAAQRAAPHASEHDDHLQERYEHLRAATAQAISELDQLIAREAGHG